MTIIVRTLLQSFIYFFVIGGIVLDDFTEVLLSPVPALNKFCMHQCEKCGRSYRYRENLLRHIRVECGKEAQFHCFYCKYKSKQKNNLQRHLRCRHNVSC